MKSQDTTSIIALDKFIQSTRDSGYKSTPSAVAELVDNALQAGATSVHIQVHGHDDGGAQPAKVTVADNGHGMDRVTLQQALRFGGSSRFNDRSGLGRFGMGLPNASLSQAKRVEVYSWQSTRTCLVSYLDVDEIASGHLVAVPVPLRVAIPEGVAFEKWSSGTVVNWSKCDRLDHRRISTTARKISEHLGRTFRYFIWGGTEITVNGKSIEPVDPLFLRGPIDGAAIFQEPSKVEVYVDPNRPDADIGTVTITFTELPVIEWQDLPNDEKRRRGVSNGAGVSIVRGDREVDFGWFFMGSKRRENYDDWWRCEIKFDPVLDEAFGITHTKQQIRPRDHLLEALQAQVESVAKALNGRVRQAHLHGKTSKVTTSAEMIAEHSHSSMKPLPAQGILAQDTAAIENLAKRNSVVRNAHSETANGAIHYRLVEDASRGAEFFSPVIGDGMVVGTLNPKHRFYTDLYLPLLESRTPETHELARVLQLVLLAAVRAEAIFTRKSDQAAVAKYRKEWSETMDTLLRNSHREHRGK